MRSLVTPWGMLVCIVGVPRAPRDRDVSSSGVGPVFPYRYMLVGSLNNTNSSGRDAGGVSVALVRPNICISEDATPC